jgi:hypothetical protein
MSASRTIAETRKRNKPDERWSHIEVAKACLKRKKVAKLSDWEVTFLEAMMGWHHPTAKQLDSLRFCCEKAGVKPPQRQPGEDG